MCSRSYNPSNACIITRTGQAEPDMARLARAQSKTQAGLQSSHHSVEPMVEPTKLKAALALEPRVVMAAMQTTMMRDSITAYSTAVGPSSFFRNENKLRQSF